MTSMERFGPVALDYYVGRRVIDVVDGQPGEGNPVWEIILEGEAVIQNFDPTIAKPTAIKGSALTMTILGGRVLGKPVTELRFGLEKVILNPLEHAMGDKHYTKGQRVFPQRSEHDMPRDTTPPEHPEGRTAEGPEEVDGT